MSNQNHLEKKTSYLCIVNIIIVNNHYKKYKVNADSKTMVPNYC